MPASQPTVAEQLAALPAPCAHQHHKYCTDDEGRPLCDCPSLGRPESIEAFRWTYGPEFARPDLNIGAP